MALGITLATGSAAMAATWEVTLTNLTHGNHFTPLLVTAHDQNTHLFEVGAAASAAIEDMAECGSLAALEAIVVTADTVSNPNSGFLDPGDNTSAMLTDPAGTHLSIVAMVLPTNDAFMGLESQLIPTDAGTYTYWVNAYDAGTEQNDEILSTSGTCAASDSGMMPGAPGGNAGSGATGVTSTEDANTMIHIHRGVLGDDNDSGGKSDLDNTIHRWQNPVAKITVKVTP